MFPASRSRLHPLPLAGLAVILLSLAAAATARAQAPPSLTREQLTTMVFGPNTPANRFALTCSPDGSGTLEYSVSGSAVGPYPGSFTETGRVVMRDNRVESLSTEFEIISGPYRIEGTKRQAGPGGYGLQCFGGNSTLTIPLVLMAYSATVYGPEGTTQQQGTASFERVMVREAGNLREISFWQTFLSSSSDPVRPGPAALSLTPADEIGPVSRFHSVTATVTDAAGAAVGGVPVAFRITYRGDIVRGGGSCTTNAAGRCTFSYRGPLFPRADLILAGVDVDRDGQADLGGPGNSARKIWTYPATTPGHVTGTGRITADGRTISFRVNAKSDGHTTSGTCTVIDRASNVRIECLTLNVLVVARTRATFYGLARVNDILSSFRIEADDLGGRGVGRDSFRIDTQGGFTAAGLLRGGNIQIHR